MAKKIVLIACVCLLIIAKAQSQAILPSFTIEDIGQNKVRISWVNPYPDCIQLNIQRSFDGKTNFRTIFSAQSPQLAQNGYVDAMPPNNKMYYRIFYVLPDGKYFFTEPCQPHTGFENNPVVASESGTLYVKLDDIIIDTFSYDTYKHFRDSIITQTRDSLFNMGEGYIQLRRYISGMNGWQPSQYIFVNREGFITVKLPDAKTKKYKLIIYDTYGKELHRSSYIKSTDLILDKGSFMRAGWYTFDLYEDGNLKEKNKFYLAKEF